MADIRKVKCTYDRLKRICSKASSVQRKTTKNIFLTLWRPYSKDRIACHMASLRGWTTPPLPEPWIRPTRPVFETANDREWVDGNDFVGKAWAERVKKSNTYRSEQFRCADDILRVAEVNSTSEVKVAYFHRTNLDILKEKNIQIMNKQLHLMVEFLNQLKYIGATVLSPLPNNAKTWDEATTREDQTGGWGHHEGPIPINHADGGERGFILPPWDPRVNHNIHFIYSSVFRSSKCSK